MKDEALIGWMFIGALVIGATLALLVYFLPTMIARMRGHSDSKKIFWTNLFFGWTGVGLLGCVVWACSSFDKPTPLPKPRHANRNYPKF